MIIDLRSDTVTSPTEEMRNAMRNASVGDDVFGEDPTINQLEKTIAEMFGMEAALFCPTATMCNQIAMKVQTQPMDEIICDFLSHIYQYEVGGYAFLSGCSIKYIHTERGILSPDQIKKCINPFDIHKPISRLVCIENTCNKGGGSTYTLNQIKSISDLCKKENLALHLDGSRVFNALTFTGDDSKQYGNYFNTITICLSKGLGCPAGALLLGNAEVILKARRIRKVFGGGMRQAGILAAAGIYALENNIGRLQIDHSHASIISETLSKANYIKNVMLVETNIIIFQLQDSILDRDFIHYLKSKNIKAFALGNNQIRFVTHLDITYKMIAPITEALLHFRN